MSASVTAIHCMEPGKRFATSKLPQTNDIRLFHLLQLLIVRKKLRTSALYACGKLQGIAEFYGFMHGTYSGGTVSHDTVHLIIVVVLSPQLPLVFQNILSLPARAYAHKGLYQSQVLLMRPFLFFPFHPQDGDIEGVQQLLLLLLRQGHRLFCQFSQRCIHHPLPPCDKSIPQSDKVYYITNQKNIFSRTSRIDTAGTSDEAKSVPHPQQRAICPKSLHFSRVRAIIMFRGLRPPPRRKGHEAHHRQAESRKHPGKSKSKPSYGMKLD